MTNTKTGEDITSSFVQSESFKDTISSIDQNKTGSYSLKLVYGMTTKTINIKLFKSDSTQFSITGNDVKIQVGAQNAVDTIVSQAQLSVVTKYIEDGKMISNIDTENTKVALDLFRSAISQIDFSKDGYYQVPVELEAKDNDGVSIHLAKMISVIVGNPELPENWQTENYVISLKKVK